MRLSVLDVIMIALENATTVLARQMTADGRTVPLDLKKRRQDALMEVKLIRDFIGTTRFQSQGEVNQLLLVLRECEKQLDNMNGYRSQALTIVVTLQRYLENAGESLIEENASHKATLQKLVQDRYKTMKIFLRFSGGNAKVMANNFRHFNAELIELHNMLSASSAPS